MTEHRFHPLVQEWFESRFGAPTDPQRTGWPWIAAGNHTLIAAPTGSGKTLAAFLVCIDRFCRDWLAGDLKDGIQVVYVSPLKALSNDIDRNLQSPLEEISALATASGLEALPIRTAVRTGDTPSAARQAMLRKPPHILVTTPESLYLLLTSPRSRDLLRSVKTVIVDEIHALARDKRGSHLALSLERLADLAEQRLVRIGLSATQRPIDQIARFLVGSNCQNVHLIDGRAATSEFAPSTAGADSVASAAFDDVLVIDSGHARQLDLMIETPPSDLSAVCSHEQWDEVYQRLVELINQHRSTLVFVNTRRLAERVSHRLREVLGEGAVAGHHGSLSRQRRLNAEQRLKNGQLKAIVATASLEMGIDIGYIDLVCQVGAIGPVPTRQNIVFERFFDESGGMQLVIHAPLGGRINRAWGLALRKRFCRSFDFELQAAATDNGILLSVGPQHSFPIESLFKMLRPHNAEELLQQAVLAAPMFGVRWRWNVTRALAVLRNQAGKKVPHHLQRFRSDDLLAAAFPETVGCLENHQGDVEIPDHPLVRQTMHDCLTEAMDVERWVDVLREVQEGDVHLTARDSREPSPFCYELLNANPYAFLDDAPLEERRTRAVATRRGFTAEDVRDLARLDPDAIAAVRQEAWPVVRDADELHDALLGMTLLAADEGAPWRPWFEALVDAGRATTIIAGDLQFWIAAESWPAMRALFPHATVTPHVNLPLDLEKTVDRADALGEVLRGRLQVCGPVTGQDLARKYGIPVNQINASLEVLEGRGIVLRGQFEELSAKKDDVADIQWCDRRLLARIHRRTMDGLRRRIKPVSPEEFVRFLARHHRLTRDSRWAGQVGVREAVSQLQGFDLPAGLWESAILAARVDQYDPQWLDQLFLAGEVTWGRLRQQHRDEEKSSRAAITRAMPISLILRSELSWLLPRDDDQANDPQQETSGRGLSSRANRVFEALRSKGALFFAELAAVTDLLPTELEEALRELAAAGLVTSDAFAPIRSMVTARRSSRHRQTRRTRISGVAASAIGAPSGRWSCFPGHLGSPPENEQRIENWCRLLLRRYGVVFRDLLARESAAPSWRELVYMYRRMELRGDVRGGRFVSDVGGEQFADEAVVEPLRAMRETDADDAWLLISAVDPLNLNGIVTDGPRISAMHKNAVILQNGRCVAAKQADQIVFFEHVSQDIAVVMRRALQTSRVDPASHIRQEWVDGKSRRAKPKSEIPIIPSRTMRQ